MDIKEIDNNLRILQENIEHMNDSFKDLKIKLMEASEHNAEMADIKLRQRDQSRFEYDKIRKEYNDLILEIESLKRAYASTGDLKIKQNLDFKEAKLKELKASKSNAFWEKVKIGREYKAEKANSINESFEYENLKKINLALSFLQQTQYGRVSLNGELLDASDPAGITQSAEEFEQSMIGTEIEHALYLSYAIQPGYFLVLGIGGSEEPHIVYFFDEKQKVKAVDPKFGNLYDPSKAGQPFISKDNMTQIIKLYTKNIEGPYQVFNNIDFLIGQPISLYQDLIIQNWENGLLDIPSPLAAQEEIITQQQMEELPQEQVQPVQENMLFWNEALDSPIPNNGANISTTTQEDKNKEIREKIIQNKTGQINDKISNISDQIEDRKENITSIKNQINPSTSDQAKIAADRRLRVLDNQNQTLTAKKQDLEDEKKELNDQKQKLLNSSVIYEAKTPVELAISGNVGAIFNYLLSGTSTGDPEQDYIAERIKDSAVIKNILYKYDRELNKINPDNATIATLKLKLKSEINKYKKNK